MNRDDDTGRGTRGADGLYVDADFDDGRPDPIEYEPGSPAVPHAAPSSTICPRCGGYDTEIDKATGLRLGDGSTVDADAVLVAVGAMPNIEVAERSGLVIAHSGIAVDESLKSSDDDIYAVGDIAAAEHPLFGVPIRTEHWANALKQPAVAAAGMLGTPGTYDELPYFFTDQFDLGMEYVGYAPQYQLAVTRGDLEKREFTMFWLDNRHRVLAGMNVNIWEGLDDIKQLIRSRRTVDAEALADPSVSLAALAG